MIVSSATAQSQCLPELSYITTTKLESVAEICTNASINLTNLAEDAVDVLFTKGVDIPLTCNTTIVGDVDCRGSKKKTQRIGKTPKTPKTPKVPKRIKTKGTGRKNKIVFDVQVSCQSDPCVREGSTSSETASKLNMLVQNFTSAFAGVQTRARSVTVDLPDSFQFSAKVYAFSSVATSCNNVIQTMGRLRSKGRSNSLPRSLLRRISLCGKFKFNLKLVSVHYIDCPSQCG